MEASTNHHDDVTVIIAPFAAQGHLSPLLQLSCQISSHSIPVHYVASETLIRQAKSRVNGLDPLQVAKIRFHGFPIPPFSNPPPRPDSSDKFPRHLQPAYNATSALREPFATLLRQISEKSRRVVVIHDFLMAYVVQDVAFLRNAESYVFNSNTAVYPALTMLANSGKPIPPLLQELLPFLHDCPGEFVDFAIQQYSYATIRAGTIHNTSRLIEGSYLDLIFTSDDWAIGPFLPVVKKSPPSGKNYGDKCLEWLDKQEAKSVIYISFGTSTSLPDEQVKELALGLEQSKVKFLWVLRDADKGDIFDGEARRPGLPEGFEERMKGVGLVVREWAPQPEILGHPSTGGFISHCGWNSCLDSIVMGVPVAAWPMHSDQPMNGAIMTNILKTGLFVTEWADREEVVKASTVEKAVTRLMVSEEGNGIRKRAEELAVNMRHAAEEGGASRLAFDSFIAHITR